MEFWPEDNQIQAKSSKKHGKGKSKTSPSGPAYLEAGRIQAVTLVENESRFEWTSPLHLSKSILSKSPKLTVGPIVEVFKPTRPPSLNMPATSLVQRVEQGANFLRTHFPEIEIAAELVRAELSADAQATHELDQYDPFAGNVLELLQVPDAVDGSHFLVFPMGEANCDLNISPFENLDQRLTFRPSARPVRSFATPIMQLALSKFSGLDNFLAARTFGSTVVLRISVDSGAPQLAIPESAVIFRDDIGLRPPLDIMFHSRHPDILLVNDEGAVYKCSLENNISQLAFSGIKNTDTGDKFWRLARAGSSEDGCLLSSSKNIQELDFRTADLALNLLSISTSERLTCVEHSGEDFLIRSASTERILWIDRRFPSRALLGVTHRRNHDRTLAVHTMTMMHDSQYCLVTSRKNNLVTVYDVSRSEDQLLHMNNMPYSFSLDMQEDRFSGDAFLGLGDQSAMFRITERGRVSCVNLTQTGIRDVLGGVHTSPMEVSASREKRREMAPLEAREFSETNMRPAYEQLFPSVNVINAQEEEDAEDVYDLLEELPAFWQKLDAPVEQVLTTYDILFRSGDAPKHRSRADFLSQSIFNSTRGYRIVSQGRFPVEEVRKGASWHSSIASVIGSLDETTVGDIRGITGRLHNFDLASSPSIPAPAMRRQDKDREQLALDLTLSKEIFSSTPFLQSSGSDDAEESGPSIRFRYLQPVPKRDYYSKEEQENSAFPLGVRLLLDEWDVGMDPEKYVFNETLGSDGETNMENKPHRGKKRENFRSPPSPLLQAQSLPAITALSSTQPTLLPPRVVGVESRVTQCEEIESQSLMTNTQVLSGPFGGRPAAAKKSSMVKKRMGGF
ncbi:hypothetical protein D9757_013420 [Collybiopsis confluens]|uniref:RRN6 K-rich C-terminal domain-containing protein n=1 Tax=Collybiopsis confluens TaxID=2823264 RepID=A0A8H5CUK8_9AGAR|nr:hypothetical protein D9757_013420 [Collybiopsis confluens]